MGGGRGEGEREASCESWRDGTVEAALPPSQHFQREFVLNVSHTHVNC